MERDHKLRIAEWALGEKRIFLPNLNEKGVALIMVLWIIAILSVIAFEFSYAMRTEVKIVKNFQEELQLYALAEGGVERAIAELVYKHDPRVQNKRRILKSKDFPSEKKEWVTDGRGYPLTFELGVCEVRVRGEAGKININLVSGMLLRKIITNLGVEGEAEDIVVDSLLDWRDPDDLYRLNGAENDYYQSLPEPYECKNGNLDSNQSRIPVEYQRSLFGPGVDAALKTLQEEMAKRRRGENSELMEMLISKQWRDLLGPFQAEPREVAVAASGAAPAKAGPGAPPSGRPAHDVTQHWNDNPAAGLTNP